MRTIYYKIVIIMVAFLLAAITPTIAQEDLPLLLPGTVEGTGTHFEVTDSEYLNVTLESSEPVHVMLESIPELVMIDMESAEGVTPIQITLGGFTPITTYYKYEDDYHNEEVFTTDAYGCYTYLQDLIEPHLVLIQPNASTHFINAKNGGDCYKIGIWDIDTKTCTLIMDVYETIQIDSDSLTLDGNGYSSYAKKQCIYVSKKMGVTLKNLNFPSSKKSIPIHLYGGGDHTLIGNIASVSYSYGFRLYRSSYNTLTDNVALNNNVGIYLYDSSYNTLTENVASNNKLGIMVMSKLGLAHSNTMTRNIIATNGLGISIYSGGKNEIYNNNFIHNIKQAGKSGGNVFNLPSPIGGNFWSDWTTPDDDGDGFVDTPYYLGKDADYLPFTVPVYDPGGGFVTGGGWIWSPEGACQLDACAKDTTGKANFGFVSKYKKGATVPTGQTQFQFEAGDLNFHSDAYDWLVVAGPHAKYKGAGTINGGGNYGFMLTATDSEISGGGEVDGFRIKIWDKDAGDTVVYDNQVGESDDSTATTMLGGGSIKIHKGK